MGQPETEAFVPTDEAEDNTNASETSEDMTEEQLAQVAEENQATAQAEEEAKAAAKAEKEAADASAFAEFKEIADKSARSEDIDAATGVLPEADVKPVLLAYSKIEQAKTKRAARDYLRDSMTQALADAGTDASLFTVARGYLHLFKETEAASSKREPAQRVVVDPTDAFVERIVAMMLAANLALVPEGVSEDWKDRANKRVQEVYEAAGQYKAWLEENHGKSDDEKSEEPKDVPAEVLAAARIASGRAAGRKPRAASTSSGGTGGSGGGYSGERRSVAKHIAEAFADQPVGTILSIAEIAKFSSQEYGTDHPSSGAVTSALFKDNGKGDPKEGVADGIVGVHANTEGQHAKGAKKFA